MKIPYHEDAVENLIAMKDIYSKIINRIGHDGIKKVLKKELLFNSREAAQFLKLFDKIDLNYEVHKTFPENYFFIAADKLPKLSVRDYAWKIKQEYYSVTERITRFRKLPHEFQKIVLRRWPKEYHGYLLKTVNIDSWDERLIDEDVAKDTEATKKADKQIEESIQSCSERDIAIYLLAKRWKVKQTTIAGYFSHANEKNEEEFERKVTDKYKGNFKNFRKLLRKRGWELKKGNYNFKELRKLYVQIVNDAYGFVKRNSRKRRKKSD